MNEFCKILMDQLGGGKFIAMTGSKNFTYSNNELNFKVGSGAKNKITHVRIILTPSDTYTMTFFNVRGVNVKTINEVENVYYDQLQAIFTENTGMYTYL